MNYTCCDGELEHGQCNDSRKKSLKKGGFKADGGHGCAPMYRRARNEISPKPLVFGSMIALSGHVLVCGYDHRSNRIGRYYLSRLIQGAAIRAVHRQRRIRHWRAGTWRFSVLAGMKLIVLDKSESNSEIIKLSYDMWFVITPRGKLQQIDGVASGTWSLMQFLGLGAEIEGLLARNRRGGDERIYIQFKFTVTNEMGDQEASNLWDRLRHIPFCFKLSLDWCHSWYMHDISVKSFIPHKSLAAFPSLIPCDKLEIKLNRFVAQIPQVSQRTWRETFEHSLEAPEVSGSWSFILRPDSDFFFSVIVRKLGKVRYRQVSQGRYGDHGGPRSHEMGPWALPLLALSRAGLCALCFDIFSFSYILFLWIGIFLFCLSVCPTLYLIHLRYK